MTQPALKIQSMVWGGLIVIVLGIAGVFLTLPAPGKPLPVYGNVPDFSLSNQDGQMVSQADWHGQIELVDLIFTRCPGQCLLMSATMKQLQDALPASPAVHLVSLTSDPAYDTPAVLKKYGERYGAREGVWSFLTGPKSAMRQLAVDGLKLTMMDKTPAERENPDDLFVHSTTIELIDRQGRIRGCFAGETSACIPEILGAIQKVAHER